MSLQFFVFCIFASLIKNAFGQCFRNAYSELGYYPNVIAYEAPRIATGYALPATSTYYSSLYAPEVQGDNFWRETILSGLDFSILNAFNGGTFNVQSYSPIAPGSITIQSENVIEGPLSVSGMMPFLSVVALEGHLPTYGGGAVGYACGDGIAILSENFEEAEILGADINGNSYALEISAPIGVTTGYTGITGMNLGSYVDPGYVNGQGFNIDPRLGNLRGLSCNAY